MKNGAYVPNSTSGKTADGAAAFDNPFLLVLSQTYKEVFYEQFLRLFCYKERWFRAFHE